MRTYALGLLARAFQTEAKDTSPAGAGARGEECVAGSFDSYGVPEETEWATQGGRSRDFEPLTGTELRSLRERAPFLSFAALCRWVWRSLSPFVPLGARHNQDPLSGIRASQTVKSRSLTGLADLRPNDASPAGEAAAQVRKQHIS